FNRNLTPTLPLFHAHDFSAKSPVTSFPFPSGAPFTSTASLPSPDSSHHPHSCNASQTNHSACAATRYNPVLRLASRLPAGTSHSRPSYLWRESLAPIRSDHLRLSARTQISQ